MNTKKLTEDEIIHNIDRAINELVYEKTQLIKAYNYYHGKRDPEQFRHLEENYGIGTPTSVEFVPLVRKHVDVLIGEYLSLPLQPKISCKDKSTLSNINRDKQLKINDEVASELKKHLTNAIYSAIYQQQGAETTGKQPDAPKSDQEVERMLSDLADGIERNFVSDYEIAGQNIIDWSIQSRNIDFRNKLKILLIDLLVTGTCYYKVVKSPSGENVSVIILNPINTFIDRNPESPYLKESMRGVCRFYMTKDQILAKHGRVLKKEDLDDLDSLEDFSIDGSTTTYIRSYNSTTGNTISDGILGGFEVTPLLPYERNTSKYFRMYPVYEVEWLKTEKEKDKFVTYRYEGTRIGTQIYIPTGKVEEVSRSMDDPTHCTLSINGMFYSDRNGDPFSIILATANLQDKFDVLNFYRDNVIAESGSVGDWVDIAYIPKVLGADLVERLMKWKAYKKQGFALIDSSQEGVPPMNTTFGGYDDTIKLNTIQAIDLAIQRVEETTSTITGVFREKLGGIEQRDAVTNVQVGVKQSSYITKQYYQLMDLMTKEMLLDILNLAKVVYKKGFSGTLILGDRANKVFTSLPKHFTVTDYDIHIAESDVVIKEQETIKQVTMEFVKGGMVDPEVIMEALTATGLTKMKEDVNKALGKKRAENNQVAQLNQQVEELTKQLKEATAQAKQYQAKAGEMEKEKLNLDAERLGFDKEVGWYKAKNEAEYKEAKMEWDKKRVQLEAAQLFDDNKRNDTVRQE